MQDTPEFQNLKNQFNQYTISDLLDLRESVNEPDRGIISSAHAKIAEYFADTTYRQTLSTQRKTAIEAQISNIIGQFNTLHQWQKDNSTQISQVIPSVTSSVSVYIDELDQRFTLSYQVYLLQNRGNIEAALGDARKEISMAVEDAQTKNAIVNDTVDEVRKLLKTTETSVGLAASYGLADYYQTLATGRTVSGQDDFENRETKELPTKKVLIAAIPISIFLFLIVDKIFHIINNNQFSASVWATILISLITPLIAALSIWLINMLNRVHPGGYARSATLWMAGSILATIGTAVYAAILVLQLGNNSGWEEIVPKVIGLLAPAYFVRFCVQNYKANKHLVIQNTHRATVAKITEPFTRLIAHANPDFDKDVLNGRIELTKAAAQVIFSQSESGYLTTKEGAGSSDNMLDSLTKNK